jgi:hypothetical protein
VSYCQGVKLPQRPSKKSVADDNKPAFEEEAEETDDGSSTILGMAFVAGAVSIAGGAYIGYSQREKFEAKISGQTIKTTRIPVNPEVQKMAIRTAFKALFYGSVLCWTTFGAVLGLFITVTGISSFKQFSATMRSLMERESTRKMLDAERAKVEGLSKRERLALEEKEWNELLGLYGLRRGSTPSSSQPSSILKENAKTETPEIPSVSREIMKGSLPTDVAATPSNKQQNEVDDDVQVGSFTEETSQPPVKEKSFFEMYVSVFEPIFGDGKKKDDSGAQSAPK